MGQPHGVSHGHAMRSWRVLSSSTNSSMGSAPASGPKDHTLGLAASLLPAGLEVWGLPSLGDGLKCPRFYVDASGR